MGGGLFGSKKSEQSVPQYVTDLGTDASALARARNDVGYIPFYGPETAAFTPMQTAAMQGANTQASALGLPTAPMSIPQATDFGSGVMGYNSAGMMEDSLARLKAAKPDVYDALMRLNQMQGRDPMGGQADMGPPRGLDVFKQFNGFFGQPGGAGDPSAGRNGNGNSFGSGGGGGGGGLGLRDAISGLTGGYSGVRDMVDGGGPGRSGSTFSGGGRISGALNGAGVSPRGSGGSKSKSSKSKGK